MLPDLTVLIALFAGLLQLKGAPANPTAAIAGTALCLLVAGALSRMAVARGLRALDEGELIVAEISARWTGIWPFLGWLACLFFFDWGAWVNANVPRMWWLASYFVLLLPAVVIFGVGWVGRAQLEGALVSRKGGVPLPAGARAAFLRGLRRNGIVFLPLLVVFGLSDGIWVLGQLGVEPLRRAALWQEAMPLLNLGLMLGLIVLALPLIPRIFARALNAQPLPEGRLRSVLERAAASIDLRYRNIMLWRTGGRVFNAMVVGFTHRSRLIFLTDGLIDKLTEDETLAVFFHEAGHAKRHHLPLFLVAFFALSLLFYALADVLAAAGLSQELQMALHLVLVWFVLLGWVSRRFERESDVFGAEHAALLAPDAPPLHIPGLAGALPHGAALMMRALERIRQVVGTSYSHRHGSVEDRVNFVALHATDADTRARFARTRRSILLGVAALAVGSLGATAWRLPTDLAHAEAWIAGADGLDAYEDAWRRAHGSSARAADGARASWQRAHDAFDRAARRVADRTDAASRELRIRYRHAAAETALRGLRDLPLAEREFEATRALLAEPGLDDAAVAYTRFQVAVDLGRMAAWKHAALPVGDPDRDIAPARAHAETARRTYTVYLGNEERFPVLQEYFAERLRLLDATIDGAHGDVQEARLALVKLAQVSRDARSWANNEWVDLAEDAQAELERLAGP